jgi:aminopeptidase N
MDPVPARLRITLALFLFPILGWSQGIGDPTFPDLGNLGYRATNYRIKLSFDPKTNLMQGDVTMTGVATGTESDFALDFSGFVVKSESFDGQPVPYERTASKLRIKAPLANNQTFTLETVYEGSPQQVPTKALGGLTAGWITYPSGSVTVCEPDLAHTWFPCNDHPLNKATFDFEVDVPAGYRAIANGTEQPATNGGQTFIWHMDKPIQTCMALVAIGKYATSDQIGPEKLPIRNYFPATEETTYTKALSHDPAFLQFLESRLGPYPFSSYGTIELPSQIASVNRVMSGSALETVTVPVFSADAATEANLIHEMCHQWMGDCVSISNWGDDIWWVEGFATYAEYMRFELTIGKPAYDQAIQTLYGQLRDGAWSMPGHLSAENMFSSAAYQSGCMVFHALRLKLGDESFFKTIRKFIDDHRYGNGSTEALIKTASEAAGEDMHPFFHAWLFGDTIPSLRS